MTVVVRVIASCHAGRAADQRVADEEGGFVALAHRGHVPGTGDRRGDDEDDDADEGQRHAAMLAPQPGRVDEKASSLRGVADEAGHRSSFLSAPKE
jgi:hypothetical protein